MCPRDISDHTGTQEYLNLTASDRSDKNIPELSGRKAVIFHFPHLIRPQTCPVEPTSGRHLLPLPFPLPSAPHPLADIQLRSSYQLPTSPDGHYRWSEVSAYSFSCLHLLIFPPCFFLFLLTKPHILLHLLFLFPLFDECPRGSKKKNSLFSHHVVFTL